LGRTGDWEVAVKGEKGLILGRVCAVKKSPAAAQKARQAVLRASEVDWIVKTKFTLFLGALVGKCFAEKGSLKERQVRLMLLSFFRRQKSFACSLAAC